MKKIKKNEPKFLFDDEGNKTGILLKNTDFEKQKKGIFPQYVKDVHGKATHVYLPLEVYESMMVGCKAWEKIQKKKGVRWIQISRERVAPRKPRKILE